MFNFVLVGLNHRTAKLDIRQLASFNGEQLPEGLRRLSSWPGHPGIDDCLDLQPVEVIASADPQSDFVAFDRIISFRSQRKLLCRSFSPSSIATGTSRLCAMFFVWPVPSIRWFLENRKILGQLKSCYTTAVNLRTVGSA